VIAEGMIIPKKEKGRQPPRLLPLRHRPFFQDVYNKWRMPTGLQKNLKKVLTNLSPRKIRG
jgi:hypothetical protein